MRASESPYPITPSNCVPHVAKSSTFITHTRLQAAEIALHGALQAAQTEVHTSLCDNLNTGGAMDALSSLIKATNIYLAAQQVSESDCSTDGQQTNRHCASNCSLLWGGVAVFAGCVHIGRRHSASPYLTGRSHIVSRWRHQVLHGQLRVVVLSQIL
jgi:hypothetical protein